jgi:hypothetical protein
MIAFPAIALFFIAGTAKVQNMPADSSTSSTVHIGENNQIGEVGQQIMSGSGHRGSESVGRL